MNVFGIRKCGRNGSYDKVFSTDDDRILEANGISLKMTSLLD
jgi:hypothetical protein